MAWVLVIVVPNNSWSVVVSWLTVVEVAVVLCEPR